MPTIVSTVGDAAANSFVSTAEADTYLDARLNADAWTGEGDDDQKARALIGATQIISLLLYKGERSSGTQRLSWPRQWAPNPDAPTSEADPTVTVLTDSIVVYFATDVIPQRIKDATCELALELLKAGTSDPTTTDDTKNITRLVAGPVEIDFADSLARPQGLSRFPSVLPILTPLLSASNGGLRVVRV